MFRRKAAAVAAAGKNAAKQGGDEVAQAMRFLAPEQDGKLRRSIRVEDTSSINTSRGERGFIGVKVRAGDETTVVTNSTGALFQNARIQEFGTSDMAANPYFFPPWRVNKSRIKGRITRAVRKAWTS